MLHFSAEDSLTVTEFKSLLERSTLGERRPIDDETTLAGMLKNAGLIITCRADGLLVGVARSVTDFVYCCYLSDLAVDVAWQKQGIGRELIQQTRSRIGEKCTLILLSAPAAVNYYPHIGFQHHPQAWVMRA